MDKIKLKSYSEKYNGIKKRKIFLIICIIILLSVIIGILYLAMLNKEGKEIVVNTVNTYFKDLNSSKAIENMEKEIALIKEQKVILEGKNASLQVNIEMLQGTINTFNSIKKTEIEAIKDNEAIISQLRFDKLKAEYENEISKLNNIMETLKENVEFKSDELNSIKESLNNVISSKNLEIEVLTKENKDLKNMKKKDIE